MRIYEITMTRGTERLVYTARTLTDALNMADKSGGREVVIDIRDEAEAEAPSSPRAGLIRTLCEGAAFCGCGAAAAMAVGMLFRALGV